MTKHQLSLQAELTINRLRMEGMIERQCEAFEIDDDMPNVPSYDPLANPQSRRTAIHVS